MIRKVALLISFTLISLPAIAGATFCVSIPQDCTLQGRAIAQAGGILQSRSRSLEAQQRALQRTIERDNLNHLRFSQQLAKFQQRIDLTNQRGQIRLSLFLVRVSNADCRLGCPRYDNLVFSISRQTQSAELAYARYASRKALLDSQGALMIARAQARYDAAATAYRIAQIDYNSLLQLLSRCEYSAPVQQCYFN